MHDTPTAPAKDVTHIYRPDVDGLRAFAVLVVVLYHAFPSLVPGGFLGVDVFFVISGFLIGGLLLDDLRNDQFSFKGFYARRIRRIFPALLVVLASTLVFGYFALLPEEFAALGKHVLAGGGFVSNLLLLKETNYFETASNANPLLHLWSLGIEEQFYIVFPLLLWCCHKRKIRPVVIVAIFLLFSFWNNIYLHRIDARADFYSPFARLWELLAGACLASLQRLRTAVSVYRWCDVHCTRFLYEPSAQDKGALGLGLAIMGVGLLGAGLLQAQTDKPWPGWAALLPVIGTVALIAAGQANPINRHILSNRVAVFIGKISYPLYLWHWVLLSFAFVILGKLDASTRLLRLGLVGASCLLAVLTYAVVERPLRFGPRARTVKLVALVVGMIAVSLAGLGVYLREGFPLRKHMSIAVQALDALRFPASSDKAGLQYTGTKSGEMTYCRYVDVGAKETVAVVGDSKASALFPAIADEGRRCGFNTLLLGWIVPGGAELWAKAPPQVWRHKRIEEIPKVLHIICERNDIKKVFIMAAGMSRIRGADINQTPEEVKKEQLRKYKNWFLKPAGVELYQRDLQNYIDQLNLHGKQVYVVADPPDFPDDPKLYVARPLRERLPIEQAKAVTREEAQTYLAPYIALLHNIHGATIIETLDVFCSTGYCMAFTPEGVPLYYNTAHLSGLGSKLLLEKALRPHLKMAPQ